MPEDAQWSTCVDEDDDDDDRIKAGQHNCIICFPTAGEGYMIYGPFTSHAALRAAGETWQAENEDDPSWWSLYLAEPYAPPRVIAPAWAR